MKRKPRGIRGWAYRTIRQQNEPEPWPPWVAWAILAAIILFVVLKLTGVI